MRATEALHLSNPATEIDAETVKQCTHLDYNKNKQQIKDARKRNRRERTLFNGH